MKESINQNYLRTILYRYFKEFVLLKIYGMTIFLVIIFSYSVYFFCNVETISNLGEEDHFFECLTAISLFLASSVFLILYIRLKNYFFLILAIIMFFGGGEEISWGQRFIGFKTPEMINEINVQHEFNVHNIGIFNGNSLQHPKNGFSRLIEMTFLYRLFTFFWGIILPFCAYHFRIIQKITFKLKVPVPPISIGIYFLFNWIIMRFFISFILNENNGIQYIDTSHEIFEFIDAFILLMISIYFILNRETIILGQDVKSYNSNE